VCGEQEEGAEYGTKIQWILMGPIRRLDKFVHRSNAGRCGEESKTPEEGPLSVYGRSGPVGTLSTPNIGNLMLMRETIAKRQLWYLCEAQLGVQ
jgi:hypothetical protein